MEQTELTDDWCPVARSDAHGGFWVASSYAEAIEVAQNRETFSSAHGLSIATSPTVVRNLPVEADPPEQRTYKRLINPYLTPAAVAPWEEPTRQLVTRLIDAFIDRGGCEFTGPRPTGTTPSSPAPTRSASTANATATSASAPGRTAAPGRTWPG
jgi:cytochrome P450